MPEDIKRRWGNCGGGPHQSGHDPGRSLCSIYRGAHRQQRQLFDISCSSARDENAYRANREGGWTQAGRNCCPLCWASVPHNFPRLDHVQDELIRDTYALQVLLLMRARYTVATILCMVSLKMANSHYCHYRHIKSELFGCQTATAGMD